MQKRFGRLLVGIMIFLPWIRPHAEAEGPLSAPLSLVGVLGAQGIQGSGMAGSVIQQNLTDPSQVFKDPSIDSKGREHKADAASDAGKAGGIVAIVTGGVLAGAGVYMMMKGMWLQGAIVSGAGAMEIAQGAASLGSSEQNKKQSQMLRFDDNVAKSGIGSSPEEIRAQLESQVREAILTPEVEGLMREKGIDPNAFMEKLMSGSLSSPEQMIAALGGPTEFTPEQWSEAQGQAQVQIASLQVQGQGQVEAALQRAGLSPSLGNPLARATLSPSGDAITGESNAPSELRIRRTSLTSEQESGFSDPKKGGPFNFLGEGSGLNSLSQHDGATKRLLAETKGILSSGSGRGRMVFSVARNTFRSFSRWRRK